MKVCVYAIAKNERKFAERWVASMKEADWIVVLDTGSTDGTQDALRELGCYVEEREITPWRFDVARNESMRLIPKEADVCVCTDLDEVLHPGWRKALEESWTQETMQGRYKYVWNFNADGSEGTVFLYDKIHANGGRFRWLFPVHEILDYVGKEPRAIASLKGVQLDHHADDAKSRSSYLPLLELAVREYPESDRNMHYLGREYMHARRFDEAITWLKKHIDLPSSKWREERCASFRFMGRCQDAQGDKEGARNSFFSGIAEAPHLREPYVDMARFLYAQEDWFGVLFMTESALKISKRTVSYICEAEAWGSLPYDLASIAYFKIGDTQTSLKMVELALAKSPTDERILKNKRIIQRVLDKQAEILGKIDEAGAARV
ncbi:MAG: glycosyl transferase family 2 [Oscillospiraceae bacterium]|jgi:glycosyltransferase involved in cell wall biosynthesis|nr:glycosyl transferase family 2 [Oscillospiraceae bacterium]